MKEMANENSIELFQRLFPINVNRAVMSDEALIELYRMLCNISGLECMEDEFIKLIGVSNAELHSEEDRKRRLYGLCD